MHTYVVTSTHLYAYTVVCLYVLHVLVSCHRYINILDIDHVTDLWCVPHGSWLMSVYSDNPSTLQTEQWQRG